MNTLTFLIGLIAPIFIGSILAIIGFNAYDKKDNIRYKNLPIWGSFVMLISFVFVGYGYFSKDILTIISSIFQCDNHSAIILAMLLPFPIAGGIVGIAQKWSKEYDHDIIPKFIEVLVFLGVSQSPIFTLLFFRGEFSDIGMVVMLMIYAVGCGIMTLISLCISDER